MSDFKCQLPEIGIVVPAYNAEKFLAETLDSISRQTRKDWQCIIVDDGSTDQTVQVANEYATSDARFKLLSINNSGQAVARNIGYSHLELSVKYVTFMDADDVWEPFALETLSKPLVDFPEFVGAHGVGEFIDENSQPLYPGLFSQLNRSRLGCKNGRPVDWPVHQPTCFETVLTSSVIFPPGLILTKKVILDEVGLFDPDLRYAEDWELLIRLCRKGEFAFINDVILKYRRHSTNTGASSRVAEQCSRAFSKAYYSSLNETEHKRIARNAWRAKQILAARDRRKAFVTQVGKLDLMGAVRTTARIAGICSRYFLGAPKPFRAGEFCKLASNTVPRIRVKQVERNTYLSIILVNYKGAADTIECLTSIREDWPDADVIVVDNCSEDGSADLIRSMHPWIQLIESPANLGFTGGNNLGIQYAMDSGSRFIWLLNNDTVVVRGATSTLIQAMEADKNLGIVTPRIDYFDTPGIPWFAGSTIDLQRGIATHDNKNPPTGNSLVEVPWISGCAMFCRSELLKKTCGLDDRYFLNWEDVDLSLRASRFDYRLALVPSALVRHKVSRSLSKVSTTATYYWMRNRLLLTATHVDTKAVKFVRMDNMRISLRKVYRFQPGAIAALAATVRADRDFARSRYGMMGS